jgi:hypothetical protein
MRTVVLRQLRRCRTWAPFVAFLALVYIACAARQLPQAMSSDSLYPVSVARDLVDGRVPFGGWAFSPAPYLFPDLTAGVALYAVTGAINVVFYGVPALSFVALSVLIWKIARRIAPASIGDGSLRWAWATSMSMFCLVFWPYKGEFNLFVLTIIGCFHTGAFLVSVALLLRISRPEAIPRRTLVLIALCFLVMTFSDPLMWPQGVLPAMYAWWTGRRNQRWWPILLIGSAGLGAALMGIFKRSMTVGQGGSPQISFVSLANFLHDLPLLLLGFLPTTVAIIVFHCVLVSKQRRVILGERFQQERPLLGGLLVMILTSLGATALTAYESIEHSRRFIPAIALPLLLCPVLVFVTLARFRGQPVATTKKKQKKRWVPMLIPSSILAILVATQATVFAHPIPDLPNISCETMSRFTPCFRSNRCWFR